MTQMRQIAGDGVVVRLNVSPNRAPDKPESLRSGSPPWLFFCCCLVTLIVIALITPISHDEDQYIGAAMLARHARPFADFLYLQTPLQPWLAPPFVGLWPGHGLLVLRLAGAILGLVVLIASYAAARAASATERRARMAVLLMLTCHAFLFGTGVVRNDMLPAAFLALALLAGVAAPGRPRFSILLWFAAGLCLGAATSTKISYALPAAGAGLFLLLEILRDRGRGWQVFSGFALGGCIGLLPILLAW